MKKFVAIAAFAIAFASSALAKQPPKHTWFNVDYSLGKCAFSDKSPEELYNYYFDFGQSLGVTIDRISPDDVDKSDDGVVHVHMTGTLNGSPMEMNLFTTIRACEKFIVDHGITPEQAEPGDIN